MEARNKSKKSSVSGVRESAACLRIDLHTSSLVTEKYLPQNNKGTY